MLKHASALAARGFRVFPLEDNGKRPRIKNWPKLATRDPETIRSWWTQWPNANIGIAAEPSGLLVLDVDNKGDKRGSEEILKLEVEGLELPTTYEQKTPTGGVHYVYRTPSPVQSKVNALARGLDIKSAGGYVVGAGSVVPAGTYAGNGLDVADAPGWLVARCSAPKPRAEHDAPPAAVDQGRAAGRARHYLEHEAPVSVEGDGGDDTAYRVACRLKDMGVALKDATDLLLDVWNPRCEPPWAPEDIAAKVGNAYRYGKEPAGSAAPEVEFPDATEECEANQPTTGHPFDLLNHEFAFVVKGQFLLWNTTDYRGKPVIERLSKEEFMDKHAAEKLSLGDGKTKPLAELWLKDARRKTYDGVCFAPGMTVPSRFYNLWTGFTCEPSDDVTPRARAAVDAFFEHLHRNVCASQRPLSDWLTTFFAQLLQAPFEKPLTAVVFRGAKGTGKNALVDRVGALLGPHYLVADDRRYLVSNFNSHWENCLFFVLDEAFWSGDKQAEGKLKGLITGNEHKIERKGYEPYTTVNLTRVAILGNEAWMVPATHDERRFTVFDVGNGRRQDTEFFKAMRLGMEAGGYRLLLKRLLEWDVSKVDLNHAPATEGLLKQKVRSLEPLADWWLSCLEDGFVAFSEFGEEWPARIAKTQMHEAIGRHFKARNVRSRVPDARSIAENLVAWCPGIEMKKARVDGGPPTNTYLLPSLEDARAAWCRHIGHEMEWRKG